MTDTLQTRISLSLCKILATVEEAKSVNFHKELKAAIESKLYLHWYILMGFIIQIISSWYSSKKFSWICAEYFRFTQSKLESVTNLFHVFKEFFIYAYVFLLSPYYDRCGTKSRCLRISTNFQKLYSHSFHCNKKNILRFHGSHAILSIDLACPEMFLWSASLLYPSVALHIT